MASSPATAMAGPVPAPVEASGAGTGRLAVVRGARGLRGGRGLGRVRRLAGVALAVAPGVAPAAVARIGGGGAAVGLVFERPGDGRPALGGGEHELRTGFGLVELPVGWNVGDPDLGAGGDLVGAVPGRVEPGDRLAVRRRGHVLQRVRAGVRRLVRIGRGIVLERPGDDGRAVLRRGEHDRAGRLLRLAVELPVVGHVDDIHLGAGGNGPCAGLRRVEPPGPVCRRPWRSRSSARPRTRRRPAGRIRRRTRTPIRVTGT